MVLRRRNLSTARITVGLPVYRGANLVAKALTCLQQQTYGNFEAIISVDGGDAETAAACRPFLTDQRFRMVVHPQRLDWVGNFNWLLKQDLKEHFCYRQHDDTTAPNFFEVLLKVADREPNAAAIYCDCRYSGISNFTEIVPSIGGEPLERLFEFIERIPTAQGPPIRGLIRTDAIRQAGLVRVDEFRAPFQIHCWLAKLLLWGSFKRVGLPLYFRLDRADSFTRETAHRSQIEWTTVFTGLLDAAMPLCHTPTERLFLQRTILARIIAFPNFRPSGDPISSAKLISQCFERLKLEANTHLLRDDERAHAVHELQRQCDEIKSAERSRIGKAAFQIRQRYRLGKVIYARSSLRRLKSQICHLLDMCGKVRASLFANRA